MLGRLQQAETIEFEKVECAPARYNELIKEILGRKRRISDVQSCESENKEDSELPLV